ncbi:MAG: hypothetical protein C0432_05240 [Candidatus Puniceispirillum sp.]|nr:hypothetical protein [Candidatus Pelagibacter sp.]MBA4283680.1 hypothetical protein [Candidatus Puniceispirillum sp.]
MSTSKIENIRILMEQAAVDAWMISVTDQFGNEQLREDQQRIKWLCGFDGSTGLMIITATKVVLFIDGRYTLQASLQINSTDIEILSINQLDAWIRETFKNNVTLGYDSWLLTINQEKVWSARAKNYHFNLKSLDFNFIDIIWKDKPIPKQSNAFCLSYEVAGYTAQAKLDVLLKWMNENHLDHLLLSKNESVNWLLNLRGCDTDYTPVLNCFALLHSDGTIDVFCNEESITQDIKQSLESICYFHNFEEMERMFSQFSPLGVIALDPEYTAIAFQNLFFHHKNIVFVKDPIILLKARKNRSERQAIRKAHLNEGIVLVNLMYWLDNEISHNPHNIFEIDVVEKIEQLRMHFNTYWGPSFPTIAASGDHAAIVHYRPNNTNNAKLEEGKVFLLDTGAHYNGGTTDMTRTIMIGESSPEVREMYTLVLKGHLALGKAVFPENTPGNFLDILARQFLWKKGVDYNHGTGHGVGAFLNVHEGPHNISSSHHLTAGLMSGMVVSNEPGYYEDFNYGIRIENLMLVQREPHNGTMGKKFLSFETLTLVPYDRKLIDKNLLSAEEIYQINTYHKHVYATLASHLEQPISRWLYDQTQPL